MLTTKQEKFVQELIKGKSQREAYKAAYNCENMKDENIDSKASNLFAGGKVRARYNELIEQSANKALWTREEAVKDLVMIKDEALKHLKRQHDEESYIDSKMAKVATDAIKELNNMYGYNEQKVDVTTDNDLQINISVV